MKRFYKEYNVWRRFEKKLVVFKCLEIVPNGGFCVQSSDVYYKGDIENQLKNHSIQFLELLLDEKPEIRSGIFNTIEEAICDHEKSLE